MTTETNREVEVEQINADDIKETDTTEETTAEEEDIQDGEETVIGPVEEDPKKETTTTTETEPTTTTKEEEQVEDPTKDTTTSTFTKKEPAPVEGETSREKGLRTKITELRVELRKKNINDSVGNGQGPEAQDKLQELRDLGYSDEEITNMEKAIDILASKKGYVKADQSYQTVVNSTVEAFIKANPEYKPENDPEDVRWEKFQSIVKSGTYNLSGKSPEQLESIFKKINKDVVDELGEPTSTVNTRKVAAQVQKIKSVSHSGGTKPTVVKKTSNIDPEVKKMFKGFDDGDLEG
jgi:hypothetical protein